MCDKTNREIPSRKFSHIGAVGLSKLDSLVACRFSFWNGRFSIFSQSEVGGGYPQMGYPKVGYPKVRHWRACLGLMYKQPKTTDFVVFGRTHPKISENVDLVNRSHLINGEEHISPQN